MDKLREKQRQLDAAQVENKLLKMKVSTGAWISCSRFPPLASSSSLSFHHQLSHSDFSILFSVGFWHPSVANPAGSDLTALRVSVFRAVSADWGHPHTQASLGRALDEGRCFGNVISSSCLVQRTLFMTLPTVCYQTSSLGSYLWTISLLVSRAPVPMGIFSEC